MFRAGLTHQEVERNALAMFVATSTIVVMCLRILWEITPLLAVVGVVALVLFGLAIRISDDLGRIEDYLAIDQD